MADFRRTGSYYGWSSQPFDGEREPPTTTVHFTAYTDLYGGALPQGATAITPLMVAEAMNNLLAANGWPPIHFMGPQVDAVLNPPAST
ncbi:hypothetical protein [Streptomyces albidoflavus]|uniref:hypothetical protein n=1 Tax=Streptomyces albidoflavus TaxID=1886 RepID=UPI0033DC3658